MPNDTNDSPHLTNFLRNTIEEDLAQGRFAQRSWGGAPGLADRHADAAPDAAKIRTRFPPEPNGYLHIGHAKSICLNFGLAQEYGGVCHMRFDDTNPEKEDQEYVDAILDTVRWLGFDWQENLYYASDYFDWMFQCAEHLIRAGHAYVDSQTAEAMRANRGSLTEPGKNSPYRDRSPEENLQLFHAMRDGAYPDGAHVLRAKIDMASPNINLRDPAIYRIRHAEHHRSGNTWCIYPMYTYAHPIEDALERITHSICTLEFEDQRPFYDWLLQRLAEGGLLEEPLPRQYEFARLNLTYVVTSKRKLKQLVDEGHVEGWNDPRMPTIVGLRRRGYTPSSLRLFCERIGVSKSDSWIDYSLLEAALRDDLDDQAPRAIAVLRPLKLVLENYPEGSSEPCSAPVHPHYPERGRREFSLTRELWIEADDFTEQPPKGYFRLFPGNKVRLRYGYIIECTGCEKNAAGEVTTVYAKYIPDTKSGTDGANSIKVKGNIHWVAVQEAVPVEIRLYERLFTDPHPDSGGKNFLDCLNPASKQVVQAYVEPSLRDAQPNQRFQFERHGYFIADPIESSPGKPVFNRITTLKDSWGK